MEGIDDEARHAAIFELRRLGDDYRELEDLAPCEAAKLPALPPEPPCESSLSNRYKYLAVAAYQSGEIGDCDLAYYLRCDIVTAREIANASVSGPSATRSGPTTPSRSASG